MNQYVYKLKTKGLYKDGRLFRVKLKNSLQCSI